MSLFDELKRRNVFRVGVAYLVVSWLLLQIINLAAPILQFSNEIGQYTLFLLVIGFISALIFAWAFELTPEGLKLVSEVPPSKSTAARTGNILDRTIVFILVFAVGFFLFNKVDLQHSPETARLDS
jgi:hypothetical protein